jgi:hypothetical protein
VRGSAEGTAEEVDDRGEDRERERGRLGAGGTLIVSPVMRRAMTARGPADGPADVDPTSRHADLDQACSRARRHLVRPKRLEVAVDTKGVLEIEMCAVVVESRVEM